MGFDLSPFMVPPSEREYVWWADDAIDRERSDFVQWYETGRQGLVFVEGGTPTIWRWAALTPTQVRCLLAEGWAGVQANPTETDAEEILQYRAPATTRAMVAYAVSGMVGAGVEFTRTLTQLGPRLPDGVLDAMDRAPQVAYVIKGKVDPQHPEAKPVDRRVQVDLLQHLGRLVIDASIPLEVEKKA